MARTKRFFDRFTAEYETESRSRHLFCKWIVETMIRHVDRERCETLGFETGNGELALEVAEVSSIPHHRS